MSIVEKKLAEYRSKMGSNSNPNINIDQGNNDNEEKRKLNVLDTPEITDDEDDDNSDLACCSYLQFLYRSVFVMIWAIIWLVFIKYEFGTVYLILSVLIWICFNTRTGPKKQGEVSAYSVFNKNCESISGTLKAEQFEKELGYKQ